MSLLIKALDKAAKDRAEAGAAAPDVAAAKSELSLEAVTPREARAAPAATPHPPPTPAAPASATASREPAQAATIIRASQHAGGGVGAYLREHVMIVFGILAALFLIGLGSYVYIQMAHPGLLLKQPAPARVASVAPAPAPPVAPASAPPVAPAPPSVTASSPVTPAPAPATEPPILPLLTLPPLLQEGASRQKPAPQPRAAAPVARAAPAAVAAARAPAPTAVRDTIKVSPGGGAAPRIHPLLSSAYEALNSGNLESSQLLYRRLLESEPDNVDALLGLAAIATRQGDSMQASSHYQKTLELDPRNALAQAGLIGMFSRADPLAAESRLKQLIERAPSAYLYFTLGNVYADESRWAEAQQAYFQAHHLQPDNPDYAYNLAVGLDRLGQPRPAVNFYRRALQLAVEKGRANFRGDAAQERISQLEKVIE